MSYIVIKLYSFECDDQGENGKKCYRFVEVVPNSQVLLRAAEAELRSAEHWTVTDGRHSRPEHTKV